jgi:hypothetical protein
MATAQLAQEIADTFREATSNKKASITVTFLPANEKKVVDPYKPARMPSKGYVPQGVDRIHNCW